MKKKIVFLIKISICIILTVNLLLQGKNITRSELLSKLIHRSLETWHYSGKKINNEFSKKGFNEYIKYLDFNKHFFLLSDIEEMQKFKDRIDEELEIGSTELMKFATQRLHQRIQQVIAFYQDILSKPFDFTKDEYIELDADKRVYCSDINGLREHWRKTLKNHTLMRYITLLKLKGNNKNKKELQEKAQKKVLKSFKSIFNRMLQANKKDALSRYINALTRIYDPHTTYFSPIDRENFNIEMSGSFQGIGALLGEEDGFIKVVRIIPGGPSWRQKQLQAKDLILKVAQGDNEPVDIIGMRTTDAVKLIRGKKGTVVKLTVKKTDGRILVIPIVRDIVIIEETFARSAVLQNKKTGKNFGYISLLRFYNDFSIKNGRNSTEDVKREVKKLKLKKVEGIILDLRENSGGSLQDAVRMAGLFISQGPIVQTKDRKSGVKVLNDPDPGVCFNGPLVVLINTLSASASEILAAALQDYRRAVIVGSAHSFGKGTVQILINLDHYISSDPEDNQSLGALKITIQKYYRITGSSNQFKGVIPDIILPDNYDYLEIGEKYLDHSLEWDAIPPTSYKKWDLYPLNLQTLSIKSKKRIQQNPFFKQLKNHILKIKGMRAITRQSQQLKKVLKEQKKLKEQIKKLEKFQIQSPHIDVTHSQKLLKPSSDRLSKVVEEREKEWFNQIKKDQILNEAMKILNDMTNIQSVSKIKFNQQNLKKS